MQKKPSSRSAFFTLRVTLTLLLCAAACSIVTGTLLAFFHSETPTTLSSQRTLSFAERVAYQRAIEDVYWRHRIWLRNRGERPDPKPSLDAIMSRADLEKKVTDYLRKSQALEDYWQRPITAEQLQAEMDRMAQHTRQPEVLHELFEALGNDPFVIAECLARPALSARLVTNFYAHDQRPNGCTDDTWTATSTANAPSARFYHTAVWTGSEMIVWGGYDASTPDLNTGGR